MKKSKQEIRGIYSLKSDSQWNPKQRLHPPNPTEVCVSIFKLCTVTAYESIEVNEFRRMQLRLTLMDSEGYNSAYLFIYLIFYTAQYLRGSGQFTTEIKIQYTVTVHVSNSSKFKDVHIKHTKSR